ncbi:MULTISPECIES: hypothetical protein [unclassified Serratia (in: enterobacteria)]|uniref:hypothetical protein n=1 Tax=unclassified Serratia (in: enterobacteria) TaxID=2647522 RepID=UPI000503615F|nr:MULTISPECIES: hypothetical protein [unclassified Serratia (in: enterobacteria)]KFK93330.1 hypothetical protein JV45_16620 [Serratia sp. Ag2]KFK98331.1 hypothetical protein IV04_13095 [Serratia sp. Ag1]
MKRVVFLLGIFISTASNAQSITTHRYNCGEFRLEMIENSMSKINGEFVTSQKIAALGSGGMKMDMTLMPASNGKMYGFEYIHPDGSKKRWLNVELIRRDMDAPRLIGSFDCKKISD